MNIGIVTSAWGWYGKYLPDWVDSVLAQDFEPAMVTVADLGMEDPEWGRQALQDSGLPHRWVEGEYRGIGHAKNLGVSATETEWIMHLDADDLLLPHALSDVRQLSERADVVSLGALRDGQPQLFPHVSAETILQARQGCLSPAPYRRWLWEKRPYITVNDWVESALWVGFAHLGARFVPTIRPGFVYRQFDDSHSHVISRADKQAAMAQLRRLCTRWNLDV